MSFDDDKGRSTTKTFILWITTALSTENVDSFAKLLLKLSSFRVIT